MSDRELLELAAKAAGIPIVQCTCGDARWPFAHNEKVSGKYGHWNPLRNDGDALRLAVKLGLIVQSHAEIGCSTADGPRVYCSEPHRNDPFAGTRRAITRAAAAIGEAMP